MAEVMTFEDLKEKGSEAAVKAAGKYLQKGKVQSAVKTRIILSRMEISAISKSGKCRKRNKASLSIFTCYFTMPIQKILQFPRLV
jgi:hypothetical protein